MPDSVTPQEVLDLAPFRSLDPGTVREVLEAARERYFEPGAHIFRQGEPGDFFCVILAGEVSVQLNGADNGREVTRLGPGQFVGEMAMLTGAPRSASVLATQSTRLLEIDRPAFDRLTASSPEFSLAFARLLSERVSRVNTDLSSAAETEQACLRLVAEQHAVARRELIGDSPSLKRLRARARELASARLVVITGPPGTETGALAWEVHRAGPNPDGPFLVMDAQSVTLSGRPPADELELELAQACTLLGMRPDSLFLSGVSRLGLLKAAHGGTLVIENADALAQVMEVHLIEFVRTGRYQQMADERVCQSNVRIILTAERMKPESTLAAMAKDSTLALPALKNRKQDLLPLIEHMARDHGRRHGKNLTGIDPEVHARLMAYDWPGNTAELEVVVRRAASLAQSECLTSDDVFLSASPSSSGDVFNMFSLTDPKRWAFASLRLGATLAGSAVFIFLLWQGWLGAAAAYGSTALALTWVFWEPSIILGSFVAARMWCAVCPIGAATGLMSRWGLQRKVPGWLRDRGAWIPAAGVAAILWAQAAFAMESSIRATAALIWAILLPALAVGFWFKRRTWCRYVCPLGQLIGAVSTCSATELRGNPGVCGTHCRDHRCFVGTKDASGCPVFEGPFAIRSNTHCVVCFECVQACENSSPAWNLRLPGAELWTATKPFTELAILVPAIMGAQIFRAVAHAGLAARWASPLSLALLCAVCVAVVTGFARKAAAAVFEGDDRAYLAHALVFLAASWEFSYQAGNLLSLAGTGWPPVMSPWAVHAFRFGVSVAGLGACLAVLRELCRRHAGHAPALVRHSLAALGAAMAALQWMG